MANTSTLEISFIDKSLAMRPTVKGVVGQWEYHPICNFVSLTGKNYDDFATRDALTLQRKHRYKWDDMLRIIIETNGTKQPDLDFDLNQVTNQAGWTLNAAGVAQCIADINTWISQCSDASATVGAGATEATLLLQREGVSAGFIFDEDEKFWEVRSIYNPTSGTWSFSYYDSFGTAGTPNGDLIFEATHTYQKLIEIQSNVAATEAALESWDEIDNDAIVSARFSKVGGRAVDTVAYTPAYTANDAANQAYDKDNGGLLVNQANLAENEDEVTAFIKATASNIGAPDKFRSLVVNKTGVVVKASTGNLYKFNFINQDPDKIIYVKIYDKSTAPLSTDVPVMTIPVPAGVGSWVNDQFPLPSNFTNGIGVRCVTGIADNDVVDPATDPIIEIEYK